ncbi:hypothetical protein BJ085DRAFT_37976 [Dimargaris cristalligena]|uniref:Uncharacterized protein n=1 Tax=Dimargaris cristalligena TaxID=215637 RepID=A0A4P9ZZQ7_9FUNG|nr:hypothetical protein BJ085DRAFT_37976 [Dimargaris cristalligena]|eukprot:RKP39197.1 hypothetical protein BJ085DRAFT_37976 [Dimargaris cristalligena]
MLPTFPILQPEHYLPTGNPFLNFINLSETFVKPTVEAPDTMIKSTLLATLLCALAAVAAPGSKDNDKSYKETSSTKAFFYSAAAGLLARKSVGESDHKTKTAAFSWLTGVLANKWNKNRHEKHDAQNQYTPQSTQYNGQSSGSDHGISNKLRKYKEKYLQK